MNPIIPGLPNLPPPPSTPNDLLRWAGQMTRATQEAYRMLANRMEQLILVGTLAERPAANDTRRYYFTPNELTDETPTGTLYFDDGTWVPVTGGAGSPPFLLTVREVDEDPTVEDVTIVEFDQADGFVISEPAPGVARVNLTVPGGGGCPPEPEVPDGDVNSTNRDFYLSMEPPCGGMLFVDVAFQMPGCHYDFDPLDPTHITFSRGHAPKTGSCPYWIYL